MYYIKYVYAYSILCYIHAQFYIFCVNMYICTSIYYILYRSAIDRFVGRLVLNVDKLVIHRTVPPSSHIACISISTLVSFSVSIDAKYRNGKKSVHAVQQHNFHISHENCSTHTRCAHTHRTHEVSCLLYRSCFFIYF